MGRPVRPLVAAAAVIALGATATVATTQDWSSATPKERVEKVRMIVANKAVGPRKRDRRIRRVYRSSPAAVPEPDPGSPPDAFPTPATTGVPGGWQPTQTRSASLTVSTPGTVVEDVRFTNGASLNLTPSADDVTVRRVEFLGGQINNQPGGEGCGNGLVVEDVSFLPHGGRNAEPENEMPAIQWGDYTARRVEVYRKGEGLFVGANSTGCDGPTLIEDSFIYVTLPPSFCGPGTLDWHTDGIQGYDGGPLTVDNTTVDAIEAMCGTAPFFYPRNQGNTSANINHLLVAGGGYSFRLGTPGSVHDLKVVDQAWGHGPIDVRCSALSAWDAEVVTWDRSTYQPDGTVRSLPCDTEDGT